MSIYIQFDGIPDDVQAAIGEVYTNPEQFLRTMVFDDNPEDSSFDVDKPRLSYLQRGN